MFESIFGADQGNIEFTLPNLLLSLGAALVLGLLISIVYRKTVRDKIPSQGFSLALVVLPAIVALIILMVGNSIARAFSLAGAFQIIRFRSAPGDSKDITYVLFTMAVGLCCGLGFLVYAIIAAAMLLAAMVLLEAVKFGRPKVASKLLKITVPEDLNYADAFDDVLMRYTTSYKRTRIKTTNMGSLYELQYRITSKDETDEKEFIDELRCRNGNLSVSLMLDVAGAEF